MKQMSQRIKNRVTKHEKDRLERMCDNISRFTVQGLVVREARAHGSRNAPDLDREPDRCSLAPLIRWSVLPIPNCRQIAFQLTRTNYANNQLVLVQGGRFLRMVIFNGLCY